MATNSGKNSRNEPVKDRSQVFNPSTGNYVKKDTSTGRFIDVKSDGKPFRGITKEAVSIKANPNIRKEVAKKSETAVINLKNRKISI